MTDLTRQDILDRSYALAELISDLACDHIENKDSLKVKGIDHDIECDDGGFFLVGSDGNEFNFDISVVCWPRPPEEK